MANDGIDIDFRRAVTKYWETFLPEGGDQGALNDIRGTLLQWFSGEGTIGTFRPRFGILKLINKENRNAKNSEVSIFSDIKNFDKYLKPLINDFEYSFFKEFNQNANQNILIHNSKKDWLITFEKYGEDQFDLSSLKRLKDFKKYTLKKNEDIYSIYSKDILEEKDNVIKQLTYKMLAKPRIYLQSRK